MKNLILGTRKRNWIEVETRRHIPKKKETKKRTNKQTNKHGVDTVRHVSPVTVDCSQHLYRGRNAREVSAKQVGMGAFYPHILSLFTHFYFTSVYKPHAEYFFLSLMMP